MKPGGLSECCGDVCVPAERDLLHHLMMLQEAGFAWEDKERGHFREDFFPPVDMPVVPHTPWVLKNIPIPPGLYDEVCAIIRKKIEAGVSSHLVRRTDRVGFVSLRKMGSHYRSYNRSSH